MSSFTKYSTFATTLSGAVNGVNTVYTIPVTPSWLGVVLDGLLVTENLDYTFNGVHTITFYTAPPPGSLVGAWVYVA